MKISSHLTDIKVGRTYFWNVRGLLQLSQVETKTVKVLELQNRFGGMPLATLQSLETNEVFYADVAHLQLDPEYLKKKYITTKRYYRRHRSYLIAELSYPFDKEGQLLIVGDIPELYLFHTLNKNGILSTYSYDWFKNLNLPKRPKELNSFPECEV